jgi:hypothetical protein
MKDWFIKFWNKPVVQWSILLTLTAITLLLAWFLFNIASILWWLHSTLTPK